MPRMFDHVPQRLHAARVSELVERRDTPIRVHLEGVAHEIAADEAGTTCDENFDHYVTPESSGRCSSRPDTISSAISNGVMIEYVLKIQAVAAGHRLCQAAHVVG